MPGLLWNNHKKCGKLAKHKLFIQNINCKNGNTTGLKKFIKGLD